MSLVETLRTKLFDKEFIYFGIPSAFKVNVNSKGSLSLLTEIKSEISRAEFSSIIDLKLYLGDSKLYLPDLC